MTITVAQLKKKLSRLNDDDLVEVRVYNPETRVYNPEINVSNLDGEDYAVPRLMWILVNQNIGKLLINIESPV